MTGEPAGHRRDVAIFAIGVAVFALTAALLAVMGQPWIAPSGIVRLWGGDEYSLHIIDWYAPSHIIHGFIFYLVLWLVARQRSLGARALIALLIEAAWEIVENTPWVINRYREATVSADYVGDTILNSMSDLVAMLVGFYLAARLPVWVTVVLAVAFELAAVWAIRDNLTLNVIMLVYPLDPILAWQAGG